LGNPILRSGSAAVVASAPGTSLTAGHPAGSLESDLILIWNTSPDNGITWSAPGFNAVAPASGSGMSAQLLWKLDNGSEPSTYAVSSSGVTNAGLVICSYGNVDQIILFDDQAYSGQVNGISGSVTPQTMQTLYPNSQLLWFGSVQDPSGGGTPVMTVAAGFASRVAQSTGTASGNNVGIMLGDKVAAATGPHTAAGTTSQNQFSAALLLGLAVANPVSWGAFRSAGARRLAPRLRRGRYFIAPPGQGPLPEGRIAARQNFRRRQPQWPKAIIRTRFAQPPWGQGQQARSFPAFIRRSARQRVAVPYIRRTRVFGPPFPQAGQGTAFPLFTRRSPFRRPGILFTRRGRVFLPVPPQGAQGFPLNLQYEPQRLRQAFQLGKRAARARTAVPVRPQANQGAQFPLWTRQAAAPPLRRFASPRRRQRIFQVPVAKITWQASAALSGTGTLTLSAVVTEVTSAALSGTGTLTVTAVRTVLASAALSGTGTLAAGALVTETAAAALSAAATMTAAGTVTRLGAAALSGTGTLTASAIDSVAVHLSGTGTLAASAFATAAASAALIAQGTLAAGGSVTPPEQRITITGNARVTWEAISEKRLMDIRESHVAESYVVTQDLEDGTFD
jgi:hypothetical protein